MRLLAVDNDPQALEMLPKIFRQARLPNVTLASSGRAALDLIENPDLEFDVLLLDIMMPEMDGIELCKRIRQIKRYRDTPILMLTSTMTNGRIENAFAAGANDYITKPFEVKDIVMRVRVAQKMASRAAKTHILDPNHVQRDAKEGIHPFSISEPLRLTDRPQLIMPFALGNYLSQLSRRRLDNCTIFALRMTGIGLLYGSAKTYEFAFGLSQIVHATSQSIDSGRLLMSYQGDGTFICISQMDAPPAWPEVEEHIQDRLLEDARILENGWPMGLEIAVGHPITPNASSNQRVKKTFERALERAKCRERIKEKQIKQSRLSLQDDHRVMAIS